MIGIGKRIAYAFRSFFSVLSSAEIPEDVAKELIKAPPPAEVKPAEIKPPPAAVVRPKESQDRAVQMLAILQRDGRLIDFFTEDLSPYSDAQVGAAVRTLQESCRQVIERYMKLEPVIASEEGQPVTVEEGFDPASVKLIGNVTGKPPLRGMLRHRGWRVSRIELPPLSDSIDRTVVAPAEVEIQG